MTEAELYEQAKEAFYAWEDKCAVEWGGYGEWGSGLSDEQRHMWCEGYVQAMLTPRIVTGNDPKDGVVGGNLPDHILAPRITR